AARADSRTSSRKPALRVFGSKPWQVRQCWARIGWMSRVKSTGAGAGPSAGTNAANRRARDGTTTHPTRSGMLIPPSTAAPDRRGRWKGIAVRDARENHAVSGEQSRTGAASSVREMLDHAEEIRTMQKKWVLGTLGAAAVLAVAAFVLLNNRSAADPQTPKPQ